MCGQETLTPISGLTWVHFATCRRCKANQSPLSFTTTATTELNIKVLYIETNSVGDTLYLLTSLAMSFEVIASLVLAAVAAYVLLVRSKALGRAPLPPGPKGYPIIGNLLDEPSDGKPWVTYRQWGHQYGE